MIVQLYLDHYSLLLMSLYTINTVYVFRNVEMGIIRKVKQKHKKENEISCVLFHN